MKPALALLALAALAAAPGAPASPFSFRTEKVAEGIYAFIETGRHAIVSGNSVAIVGDDAVAVVDTGHHPALTRKMVEEIRGITAKPVRYVITTHWHNDHVAGNFVYAEAFPQALFISHAFTAETQRSAIAPYRGARCQAFLRAQSRELRELLASGVAADGRALDAARRARYEAALAEADHAIAECLEFRPVGTDIAFADRLELRLGGRSVQVMFLGRANTAGDAVVHVPDARVAIVGDIVVHPFPFATHGYIAEWPGVLWRILALDAAAIVPGHGPVMRDTRYLEDLAALWESVDAQVRAAWRPGASLEEVRARVDLAAFRQRFAGDDPFIGANFDAMVSGTAVARAWQAVAGRLDPEGLDLP